MEGTAVFFSHRSAAALKEGRTRINPGTTRLSSTSFFSLSKRFARVCLEALLKDEGAHNLPRSLYHTAVDMEAEVGDDVVISFHIACSCFQL